MSIWKRARRKRMEHSKNFEKYKRYYEEGFWSKKKLQNITEKGAITPEEYEEITGEPYNV